MVLNTNLGPVRKGPVEQFYEDDGDHYMVDDDSSNLNNQHGTHPHYDNNDNSSSEP